MRHKTSHFIQEPFHIGTTIRASCVDAFEVVPNEGSFVPELGSTLKIRCP